MSSRQGCVALQGLRLCDSSRDMHDELQTSPWSERFSINSPRRLLQEWHLDPRKALGQNFLADRDVAEAIVARLGLTGTESVLEIGPGLGALTLPAARCAHRLVAVELDRALALRLQEVLRSLGLNRAEVLTADILRLDITALAAAQGSPWVVLGNLPYHISSPVLLQLIRARSVVTRAVLMFQTELARRLCAAPGGRDYGRITVRLGYCAEVRSLMTVSAGKFHPRPKVDSEVLEIRFHAQLPVAAADEAVFAATVRAAFGQRRKTLKNALQGGLGELSHSCIERALARAGIDPLRRAETLGVAEFVRLSDMLGEMSTAERNCGQRSPFCG